MAEVFTQEELEIKCLSAMMHNDDNFLKAINKGITFNHFVWKPEELDWAFYSRIFKIVVEFHVKYNEIITFESFQSELLKKPFPKDPQTKSAIMSTFMKCFTKVLAEDVEDLNFEYLLDELRNRSIKRGVSSLLPTLRELFDENPASEALDVMIDKLTDIKSSQGVEGQKTLTIDVAGDPKEVIALFEEEKTKLEQEGGVMIGIPEIDKATNGFREGQFIVILGELGKGKSTILLNWAVGAHENGKNVLFFSFEMPRWQCVSRYMAIKTEKPYEIYKNLALRDAEFEQWKNFLYDQREQHKTYFEFVDQPDNRTVEEIDSRIRQLISYGKPPDVIFLDYLGNMALTESQRGMKDHEVVAIATVRLRQLARRYRIPVITAQQINREGLTANRKKEDKGEYEKIMWNPEQVQDSKKTMDYADFVIGINPRHDPDDPTGQSYMWFHKVKARDTHFDPFCTLYVPEMSKIIPIEKKTKTVQYLFDRGDIDGKDDLFSSGFKKGFNNVPVGFDEEEDDIGGLI